MKLFKKLNAIQSSLLVHEMSFVLLICVTTSVGMVWAFAWQNSAQESLRLTTMNSHVQNIRGELYRQLKEVFDSVFLSDIDAPAEYNHYAKNIRDHLEQLQQLANTENERMATQTVAIAYGRFQQETYKLLTPINLSADQRFLLDKQLERFTFTELESAFSVFESLLHTKLEEINLGREQWVNRITWLAPIPVIIAIALLFYSRGFVRGNVLKPLASVMHGARRISKGDLEHTIPLMGVNELIKLAEAINAMAQELSTSRELLVETRKQAALGELVPLVAHNIRNPLAGIRAASQVTLDDEVSRETREALKEIIIAVDRLERWVTSLLTYLHPIKPHYTTVRLPDLVDDVIKMMRLNFDEKHIDLKRTGWLQNAQSIQLDSNLVEQTVFNLLQNALESSSGESKIGLTYRETNSHVILEISDEGKGIAFDPITETVTSGNTKRLSCGLGIPFALKVIKQHKGALAYSQNEPKGTRVTLSLPLEITDNGAMG